MPNPQAALTACHQSLVDLNKRLIEARVAVIANPEYEESFKSLVSAIRELVIQYE